MLITIPCSQLFAHRVGVVAAGAGGTRLGSEREQPEIRSSKFTTLNVGVTVSATLALFVGLISLYSNTTTNKMGIDFYYAPGSAPCRTVLLAAKALGVDLNLKFVDMMKGEHLTPEFVKLNPQHTVPTINDNGFSLWESRAIITYLSDQYGKNDSLYPKDPKKRALIDQRLYFDIGTLYARFADYYYPVIFGGASYEPAKLTKCEEAFKFLDTFLEKSEFAAGDKLSLADLSLVSTVTTFEVVDFDLSPYPNVARWLAKVKATAPGYEEANGKNVLIFKQMVDALTKKK